MLEREREAGKRRERDWKKQIEGFVYYFICGRTESWGLVRAVLPFLPPMIAFSRDFFLFLDPMTKIALPLFLSLLSSIFLFLSSSFYQFFIFLPIFLPLFY